MARKGAKRIPGPPPSPRKPGGAGALGWTLPQTHAYGRRPSSSPASFAYPVGSAYPAPLPTAGPACPITELQLCSCNRYITDPPPPPSHGWPCQHTLLRVANQITTVAAVCASAAEDTMDGSPYGPSSSRPSSPPAGPAASCCYAVLRHSGAACQYVPRTSLRLIRRARRPHAFCRVRRDPTVWALAVFTWDHCITGEFLCGGGQGGGGGRG